MQVPVIGLRERQRPKRVGDCPSVVPIPAAGCPPRTWWRHIVPVPAMLAILVILTACGASAPAPAVAISANLGRQSNTVPPDLPLGSFRHSGTVLRQHGKLELLFIGTAVEGNSAAESWPVVKALGLFGRWSDLRASISRACELNPGPRVQVRCKVPLGQMDIRSVPEFDFSHARYTSRDVAFVARDLIDRALHIHANLSPEELSLFNHYARPFGYPVFRDAVWEAALGGSLMTSGRGLPLVAVGGYVETGANVATAGDLQSQRTTLGLPFATIQRSLQRGRAVTGASPTLVSDVNAEANIITALICHADGKRPGNVCSRPAITAILKHVK